MRLTVSKRFGLIGVLLILVVAASAWVAAVITARASRASRHTIATALASAGISAAANFTTEDDTTKGIEATIEDESGEQVRIRIGEEGIVIEGTDLDDDFGDDRFTMYHKKGTDIVKFGEDVYVAEDEMIRGDLVVFGGDVEVYGVVGGNVVVIGGDIEVGDNAEIKGDAVVLGGQLEEAPGAIIQGERVSFKGFFPFHHFPVRIGFHSRLFDFFFVPVKFFLSLILSLLLILFLRDRVVRSEQHLTANVLKSFGVGFLIVFVGGFTLTVLTILLCITIIGIPLAFLMVVSSFGIIILSWTIAAYAIGTAVRRKLQFQSENAFFIVFIGMLILFLPGFIGHGLSMAPILTPLGVLFRIIGFFITIFAEFAGLGALFLSRFGGREIVSPAPVTAPTPETL